MMRAWLGPRRVLAAIIIALVPILAMAPAQAKTFRFAFQGGLNSLDPHTLNETFTIGMLGNVYEGLIRRGKDLKIEPALAERWELVDPLTWRFHLRKGVKFHDGTPLTADDVVFSAARISAPTSTLKTRIPAGTKVVKVDNYTIDFVLKAPNPILHYEWMSFFIMSRAWAEANDALQPQSAKASGLSAHALKANGTGPFMIVSHEPGVRTVFKANPHWWDEADFNFDEAVFTTIKSDPTRVAALLSGDVDMIDPVPPQDIARLKASPDVQVLTGPELRTIFLAMDSFRPELLYSNIKGKNPFKDVRVRRAVYQAIDIEAIKTKVMRGMATPTALPIAPLLFSRASEFKRYPYDPAASRVLLRQAGYPGGFEVEMDCPNDRYVNDEAICQAVVAMLARIDIKVKLNSLPKARYFEKASVAGKFNSSFNLVGWTPSSFDSYNVIHNLMMCRDADGNGSPNNFGGYCNPRIDELARRILVENDAVKRDDEIAQVYRILHEDVGMIPLHQQALAWGVSRRVSVVQRADNEIHLRWVRMD
jgi:peptide/nickel transport system substrate-binding protein